MRSTTSPGCRGPQVPRFCAIVRQLHDYADYLIALRYSGGTIWVSAPGNTCAGSSNGQFDSSVNVGQQADLALRTGGWKGITRSGRTCDATSDGRLGRDHELIPPGAVSLTVCAAGGYPAHPPTTVRTFRGLQQALAAAPTSASLQPCASRGPGPRYVLRFHYPQGPDQTLTVMAGCDIDNGSLSAVATSRMFR